MGGIGSDGFLESRETVGDPTDSTTVTTNVATDSPERAKPPPPKAPGKVRRIQQIHRLEFGII